jgi:hypothetical protein
MNFDLNIESTPNNAITLGNALFYLQEKDEKISHILR